VRAEIRPVPDERPGSVFGEYRSAFGIYACGYEQSECGIKFEITVPYLGEAESFVPTGCSALGENGKRPDDRTLRFNGGKHTINRIKTPRG